MYFLRNILPEKEIYMHFTCKYITLYFTLGNYTFRSCIWNLISLKWLMSYLSNGLCGCNNKIEAGLKRKVDYFSPRLLSVSSLSQWCHFWLQFSKTERSVNWGLSVQHIPDQLVFIYLFFKHKFLIKTEKVTSINTFLSGNKTFDPWLSFNKKYWTVITSVFTHQTWIFF